MLPKLRSGESINGNHKALTIPMSARKNMVKAK